MSDPEPFDIRDPLPTGTDAARGQRRHRQDLDHRRAGHPLRRRGRRPARADAGRHLRPRGQPGAARAGARPAGRGRAGAERRPARLLPTVPTPTWSTCCWTATTSERRLRAPPGGRGAGRLRRRDHRDHPPVLLDGARLARRRRRHRLPGPAGRGPRRPGRARSSTTSTCARSRFDEDGPAFTYAEALAIARAAVGDPQARLEPDGRGPHARRPAAGSRSRSAVRDEMDRRKRRLGILSYDDLLSQLADALERRRRARRATRMRQRWQIVLVDEFQDTDPVQWQVLDRAFTGHATMVLIGDPKQAIYAFRGGDVTTYLAGRRAPPRPSRRCRSTGAATPPLLDGVPGAARAAPRSATTGSWSATSSAHHGESRLVGAPRAAPFRLRVVRREHVRQARRGAAARSAQVRPHIARDLALDVRALLASGATFDGRPIAAARRRGHQLPPRRPRRRPGGAARRSACPAVIAGGGSVFATPAAVEWLTLLEALEQPHRSARVRSAALTCFFGHTAARARRAAATTSPTRSPSRCAPGSSCSRSRGIAAVLEAATAAGLPGAGARRGRRRAAAHRPAPHRRGAARGRRSPSGTAWSRC